jgi:hypothetical protein
MPKYLLLEHYRGGPEPHHPFPPRDQWAPEDVEAHIAFQRHVADVLRENGEYVDTQALTPTRTWVRNGGPDAAPVTTDGPHPETSELVAGWYMIDVESDRGRGDRLDQGVIDSGADRGAQPGADRGAVALGPADLRGLLTGAARRRPRGRDLACASRQGRQVPDGRRRRADRRGTARWLDRRRRPVTSVMTSYLRAGSCGARPAPLRG